jgi:spermidine/putrescine transport system ATP-binding protein
MSIGGSAYVSFIDVQKSYDGETLVVKDLNLAIKRGEFLTLLGPSGSGKTTTLMMLAGFEAPTHGRIELDGQEINNLAPHKRNIGMVFQNYALFPHMTVEENLAFPLAVRRMPRAEIDAKIERALSMVQLSQMRKRRPAQLSGGQQQRVALARALINQPRVLLLDEPLGALDLKLRKQMQIELKRIQTEVGITFIYVTHDQEEAMTMSDRIAVMRHGKIEQLGPPEELYERPRTAFVAGFLGVSNLLDGEVVERGGALTRVRVGDGTTLSAPSELVNGAGSVRVGIRPEKLRVLAVDEHAAEERDDDLNRLRGTVLDASYIGVSTQYLVETGDGHRLTVYAQNLETGGAAEALADGQRVLLTWKPQHTFVIEAAEHVEGDPHIPEGEIDEE